jgi:hypothetical protein
LTLWNVTTARAERVRNVPCSTYDPPLASVAVTVTAYVVPVSRPSIVAACSVALEPVE